MQQISDAPPPVSLYTSQEHIIDDSSRMQHTGVVRHGSPTHQTILPHDPNVSMAQSYNRRVTYPFVPTIDTSASLIMNGLTSPENSGSSPLLGSPFSQGGLIGVNPIPVQGIVRSSPLVGGFIDNIGLPQHTQPHLPHHSTHMASPSNSPYTQPLAVHQQPYTSPHLPPSQLGTSGWISDGEGSQNGKTYSFVPLSGVNTRKRPRRRFDEIERNYICSWGDCEKAYGTLNHLNAHVSMQKHGPKRHPSEFKEFRKEWRRKKKAEEEAAKQAVALQQQQNQLQSQYGICNSTIMTNMHPQPHPMAIHPIPHPQQVPLPHLHPNQYAHHHPHGPSHHHHPMGF